MGNPAGTEKAVEKPGPMVADSEEASYWNKSWHSRSGKPGKRSVCDVMNLHPVVWSITIADLFCHAIDGMLIAAGFLSCGSNTGWSVTLAVLLHEIPGEITDVYVLRDAG